MTRDINPPNGAPSNGFVGYSSREIDEAIENTGSGFANALAFIIEAIIDGHYIRDINDLDLLTLREFMALYNFDQNALDKAIEAFRKAASIEVLGR